MDTESTPQRYEAAEPRFEPSRVKRGERRLGRYELIYEIGHGGMANVFLARARGPANFEKWFAIKRIHENLAKDDSFVHMFLDEARIAAALQHPNVAQTFDLGEVDGKYFIAMEYLHGEPLTSVTLRMLARHHRPLPPNLAAHLIARAAEGLHHAHEATDARGQKLSLVHRDVSPHNIFVTYDGVVKITDFGVAKAAGRMTHTDTGTIKGKLSYASPEQVRGDVLDRRTDIFALGIVLFEITVGERLFRGETDAETLHRIIAGRRPSPKAFDPAFPAAVEAIIDRALAPDPADRYQTALSMARDLDRFVLTQAAPVGTAELGALMTTLFDDQIQAKERVLHRRAPISAESGEDELGEDEVGSGEAPVTTGVEREQTEPSESKLRRRSEVPPEPARRPTLARRVSAGVGALVLLALLGGGLYATFGPATTAVVRVDTAPAGARVWIDGIPQDGETPILIETVSAGAHRIMIERDGYARLETSFLADEPRETLSYALEATEPGLDAALVNVEPDAVSPAGELDEIEAAGDAPPEAPDQPSPTSEPTADERAPGDRSEPVESARRPPRARPVPATATLSLITVPWAKVYLGRRYIGDTPLHQQSIPAGRQRLRLQPEGEGPMRTITIDTTPGEQLNHPRLNLRD